MQHIERSVIASLGSSGAKPACRCIGLARAGRQSVSTGRRLFVLTILGVFSVFCLFSQSPPIREMRAVWIATVENIDWPSSPHLSADDQKREMVELLDLIKEHRLNTVVFQIRPAADAFYKSSLEPWSVWLTGQQGKSPEPFYDPLEFTISECRKRGLDIHVWLNPYRAIRDTAKYKAIQDHVTQTHPQWFLVYGPTKYFDPGLPETRNHVSRVVSDIVRRYDIDAIHMDDYFYPYRISGRNFPDDSSFALYRGHFTDEERDDWRRHNVNLIIRQLHDSIKNIKPWVEFGISPFGVWRNADRDSAGSATRAGQTNYDDLFADILMWQKEGWIDYVVPQLYWHIGFGVADYSVLTKWWNANSYDCPLYIGQAFYRIDKKSDIKPWRSAKQILQQIELNRRYENIRGSMFFSAKYLRTDPSGLKRILSNKAYSYSAIPPSNKRILTVIPSSPRNAVMEASNDTLHLSWEKGRNVKSFVVYKFRIGTVAERSDPSAIFSTTQDKNIKVRLTSKTRPSRYYYIVTSLSISNHESEPVFFQRR
jgi:uncharacterized lipoprotein YddW (UPF0748 family)